MLGNVGNFAFLQNALLPEGPLGRGASQANLELEKHTQLHK